MISKNMEPFVKGSSAVRALFEEGIRMAAEFGAENVYDFSLGNPNVPAPDELKKEICRILEEEKPTKVHGYMPNAGFVETRAAVAEDLNKRYGTAFKAENIVMTVGAACALNIALRAMLNPGDEVCVFAPYFLEYGNYVSSYGGVVVAVPANCEGGFMPDLAEFEKRITPKTKAVIINNPNNPTGVIYPAETIKQIAAILEKKQKEYGTVIYIISDEPYRELVFDGSEVPCIAKYYANTLIGYSYSKSLSLPGERIGYLVIPSESDNAEEFTSAAVTALRIMGFVNAPSLLQLALVKCLDCSCDIDFYAENARILYEGLTKLGFEPVKPQGAFYLWMKSPVSDEKEFVAEGKKHRIIMAPGSSFACPGYVRLAYCVSRATVENSLEQFAELAEKYF